MQGRPKWWPQSPSESSRVLVRMRDCLVLHKRDVIRGFAVTIGVFHVAFFLTAWEGGSNASGWAAVFALAAMIVAMWSDRFHELILRIPLTSQHLNEFERQIDDYKTAGLWPPTT